MGYRSEGLWIIEGDKDDVIAAMISAKMACIPPDGIDIGWDVFDTYQNKGRGYIKLQYDSWKWYDGYPDVQWMESCWEHWEADPKLHGRRIRIGEDSDDVETAEFGDDAPEIYVRRTIDDSYVYTSGEPLITQGETT